MQEDEARFRVDGCFPDVERSSASPGLWSLMMLEVSAVGCQVPPREVIRLLTGSRVRLIPPTDVDCRRCDRVPLATLT